MLLINENFQQKIWIFVAKIDLQVLYPCWLWFAVLSFIPKLKRFEFFEKTKYFESHNFNYLFKMHCSSTLPFLTHPSFCAGTFVLSPPTNPHLKELTWKTHYFALRNFKNPEENLNFDRPHTGLLRVTLHYNFSPIRVRNKKTNFYW